MKVKVGFAIVILIWTISSSSAQSLPPWQPGFFDIHHIHTGSGNSAFLIFPDGTTLLFDAGDIRRYPNGLSFSGLAVSPKYPSDSVSAGKAITNYIKLAKPDINQLDYAVISHFHDDHYGAISTSSPLSRKGNYRLSGITDVAEHLPIGKLIDRGYPEYDFPVKIVKYHFDTVTLLNYLSFVSSRKARGLPVEKLRAGADDQILIQADKSYGEFSVRNVKSNGEIWTGRNNETVSLLPANISAKEYNENPLSLALKFTYGKFEYFTGGDILGKGQSEFPEWYDVETRLAPILGEVDAISLNHHGIRDAMNEQWLKALMPRVLVQQSWCSNQPGEEVLHRMVLHNLYDGPRDIFATYVLEETKRTYGRWLGANYQSTEGHVVIRVQPGGDSYNVYVLVNDGDRLKVVSVNGPYQSR